MNTPSSFPVETLRHTNWGFCVRGILAERIYDFGLNHRIVGSHRDYVEQFVVPEGRIEHTDVFDRQGTPSRLLPGTVAHVQARISMTLDDISLDPLLAQEEILRIWDLRIASATKQCDKEHLRAQRDHFFSEIQRVIEGNITSILEISGIRGICSRLAHKKTLDLE